MDERILNALRKISDAVAQLDAAGVDAELVLELKAAAGEIVLATMPVVAMIDA